MHPFGTFYVLEAKGVLQENYEFIYSIFFANDEIKLNLNMVKLLRNTSLAPKGALTHSLQPGTDRNGAPTAKSSSAPQT